MSEGNHDRLVWLLDVVAREGRHLRQAAGRSFTEPLVRRRDAPWRNFGSVDEVLEPE